MCANFHNPGILGGLRLLIGLVATVALTLQVSAEGFLVELGSPQTKAGDLVTIYLVGLNPTSTLTTRSFPARVQAALVTGTSREEITFERTAARSTGDEAIAPGGFARIGYMAVVPSRMSGPARLEVAIEDSPSFAIEITSSVAGNGADDAANSDKISVQEAMDRTTTETSFFKRHVFPYEPFYFLAGPDAPAAKFQISIKYRLVNTAIGNDGEAEGRLYRHAPWSEGLHLAYTQRSLWDIQAESAPFLDSSYLPELLFERPNLIDPGRGWLERIGAQVGYQHESNGKDGANSRSLNIAYLRLPFVFGDEDNFYVTLEPRAWFYVGDLSDNPDLNDYRGYADLRLKAGWARGLQVAGWLRAGQEFDRGSAQVDVTYPLHNLLSRSFSIYLQAQYFNGYGESLLYYNQRSETWRVGIGLFR